MDLSQPGLHTHLRGKEGRGEEWDLMGAVAVPPSREAEARRLLEPKDSTPVGATEELHQNRGKEWEG